MEYVVCILAGYLIGGINPAYLFAKIKGFDIRSKGSGNAGASNAALTMGKKWGVISGALDILKALVCFKLAEWLFGEKMFIGIVAGVSCILGHIFPVYMKFRGGKGLACIGGTVLAYSWKLFLVLLAVEAVIVLVSDYICFVSISAPFLFAFSVGFLERSVVGMLILLLPALVMLCKHFPNLKRIRMGKEVHFSFLWKGKKELDCVGEGE